MAVIYPFKALRPKSGIESMVASVPYDVVTREQAKAIAGENPDSFLHVIRPEIDLPSSIDEHADEVYPAGTAALARFIADGRLEVDRKPALYVYRLEESGIGQYGIVTCCDVGEYDSNRILKHELTRPDKEDDRIRHIESLGCHTGPVLMTYRKDTSISAIVDGIVRNEPVFSFTADDGITHTGWRVAEPDMLIEAFKSVPSLYIADGHHRAAAASRVAGNAAQHQTPNRSSEVAEAGRFLSVLFPHDELRILAYNRHITIAKNEVDDILSQINERFITCECADGKPDKPGTVRCYTGSRWLQIELPADDVGATTVAGGLDLARFSRAILEPIVGVTDQRTDPRITFIGGHESVDLLSERVDATGGIAFSFYPVSVDELMAVSDAGELMPPKSTWFSPKLRSGLFSHPFRM